jgi:hypothetical protein
MNPPDCCLTLVFPPSLEDAVVGHLIAHPEWVSRCTLVPAQGLARELHGQDAYELVRGRARQVRAQMLMNSEDARALVALLREALPRADVAWWIAPVIDSGRLA